MNFNGWTVGAGGVVFYSTDGGQHGELRQAEYQLISIQSALLTAAQDGHVVQEGL
jgi:photosystem II stability/assembly factor-like uncharacterized protein